MRQSKVLGGSQALADEFARCCGEYNKLHLAVAWCGNPNQVLPYRYVERFRGTITATIGTSFNHTHPDAIEWLNGIPADVRVFRDNGELFHPKVYLFTSDGRYALFIGSSNLTCGGFCSNVEINSLIEGEFAARESADVCRLQKQLNEWHSDAYSFKPEASWLARYRRDYAKTDHVTRKQHIKTPARSDEETGTASWLINADWALYYEKVIAGLQRHERNGQGYHDVLDAAARLVPAPWREDYFADAEKRRIIVGRESYGWLGDLRNARRFSHLIANGGRADKERVTRCINTATSLPVPIQWERLREALQRLRSPGCTMVVWGRLLTITRPDLYCTISSDPVQRSLSAASGVSPSLLKEPDGYVQIIRLIHDSPWFNSKPPSDSAEMGIWKRRVAFIDAVLH